MRPVRNEMRIAVAALAGAALALLVAACEDPVGTPQDISSVSDALTADHHFHRATIPGNSIANPPPGGITITSTTDAGHSHQIGLTEINLSDLQQPNALVNRQSGAGGTDSHHHNFVFEN